MENTTEHAKHAAWNKGVIVGQKSPFKLKEIMEPIRCGEQRRP